MKDVGGVDDELPLAGSCGECRSDLGSLLACCRLDSGSRSTLEGGGGDSGSDREGAAGKAPRRAGSGFKRC